MLLGRIAMTEHGIELFDVDGSSVKINAMDAAYLRNWLMTKQERIAEILRRQARQQKELDEIRARD